MDGMQGMFGQDPALIQQAIQQQKQAGYANTQPSLFQLAQQGGNQAGGMLGDALGAATGVKDPRIAEAQLGQQVQQKVIEQAKMQGIDPVADPESFIKLVAQGWMDAGKPDKAYAAVNTLQQLQAQKSKMGLESAKTQAELRKSSLEADPALKLVQSGKISPMQYAQYRRGEITMDDLTLISNKAEPTPYKQFIPGPGGKIYVGDARTGALELGSVAGSPVVRADYSVPLQKELAGAKEAGKEEAKISVEQSKQAKQIALTINELSNITKEGGLIDQATGSFAGAGVDKAAAVFGGAPQGAVAISRLAPIADMVLKMVPRFEGPQSDKDTASYKEAAGRLADPTVPSGIKKAAALEIMRIMKERKNQFEGVSQTQPQQKSGAMSLDEYLKSKGY